MKPIPVFLTAWLLGGFGAVLGSILGNAAGKRGLFAGAIVGGIIGLLGATALAVKRRWIVSSDRRGAFIGALAGFAIAAPIAVANLHTPVTPVLICALAGAGALLGVGIARGLQGGST